MPKALFTEAVNKYDCPRCHQPAGKPCRSPKGRRALTPHMERTAKLTYAERRACMAPFRRNPLLEHFDTA